MPLFDAAQLREEKHRYFVAAGGGIALPVAGAIYWIGLAIASNYLSPNDWAFWAAVFSGAIFPLGVLLQKPLASPFLKAKSPLSGAGLMAVAAINFLWPLHMVVFYAAPSAAPLTLALGMTLHWPVIGWAYGSRVTIAHGFVRAAVVSAIWFMLPEGRFDILPVAVATLYLLAAVGMRWEISRLRRKKEGVIQSAAEALA
ncbi:DUF7010 family protein [Maricaulis parjimensis]|uniref:DUF7010 family protein n=1 Tax=Maricaulis parjimensis TaxID=144023 RepID=UPI001939E302|nr:hypothetical protein [Maricaulis parjimensis]